MSDKYHQSPERISVNEDEKESGFSHRGQTQVPQNGAASAVNVMHMFQNMSIQSNNLSTTREGARTRQSSRSHGEEGSIVNIISEDEKGSRKVNISNDEEKEEPILVEKITKSEPQLEPKKVQFKKLEKQSTRRNSVAKQALIRDYKKSLNINHDAKPMPPMWEYKRKLKNNRDAIPMPPYPEFILRGKEDSPRGEFRKYLPYTWKRAEQKRVKSLEGRILRLERILIEFSETLLRLL